VWRAADQGVFAPGTGPAYEPWHLDLSSPGPMSLVGAAILAANAHDSQPWVFQVAPEQIDLFAARVMPSPMSRLRMAARRAWSMRAGSARRDMVRGYAVAVDR
jgi:hypothetical protein